ncbi:hypothetical protein PFICI_07230 [Pestalotiopsis fici W106-1]|uniref:Uncharacterized protein n=1 Tax=Pestalotiopsis fici (strain W106-1 / CGMCC3.15140) TaxID=1229662 RepID=W3X802_PESFW|nr:uncharacterized protein PFICI_07230 [Pestalotiopsis fici W106-1]ETS82228.1 hypothetical protein PFICI_07230 [Pestalotiopsis fici W106-1]
MAEDRIPATLMDVCMRIPHFFERLIYVECDASSRTAFALTCRSIYDSLIALPDAAVVGGPNVAPLLTRRGNVNRMNPEIEDLLTILERDVLFKDLTYCHLCQKLHSPMKPVNSMEDPRIPYSRQPRCARWESLPTVNGHAGTFPPSFNLLLLYTVYAAKQITQNWNPIAVERSLDVTMRPDEFPIPLQGSVSGPFWTRTRFTASCPQEGIFIRAVKTLQLPGSFPSHLETPCQHTDIHFSRITGGFEIKQVQRVPHASTWLTVWPHAVTVEQIKGVVSNQGQAQVHRSERGFWSTVHHCRACNTEWIHQARQAMTNARVPGMLLLRIYRCLGTKDDIYNAKSVYQNSTRAEIMIRTGSTASIPATTCARVFGDLMGGSS